jgi:hypothetical protein
MQCGPPLASGCTRGAVACARFSRGLGWLAWRCLLEVGIYPTKGELLPCIMASLLEGIVVEASVVAVIMEDLDSMFCRLLFEGKLGSKCFS